MDSEKKNGFYIMLAIVLVILLGAWIFSGQDSTRDTDDSVAGSPTSSGSVSRIPKLAPALELTEKEKSGEVSEKKAEILARVHSGTPLTEEEKGEIGGIMLIKAGIYKFSEAERVAIFKALSAK